mmetsp:Transcript_49206/g.130298  ORF Transcript_49206/g.130298 Transcript_49206/m.130298 type:complete len:212 (+) Transcript_49206:3338-3973(+)
MRFFYPTSKVRQPPRETLVFRLEFRARRPQLWAVAVHPARCSARLLIRCICCTVNWNSLAMRTATCVTSSLLCKMSMLGKWRNVVFLKPNAVVWMCIVEVWTKPRAARCCLPMPRSRGKVSLRLGLHPQASHLLEGFRHAKALCRRVSHGRGQPLERASLNLKLWRAARRSGQCLEPSQSLWPPTHLFFRQARSRSCRRLLLPRVPMISRM